MSEFAKHGNQRIVLFVLDNLHYALYLSDVERVVPVVEITPLPKAPEIVTGVVNYHGIIIPVINIRKRFNLASREIDLDDQLIIANTPKRKLALIVDSVTGVEELEANQLVNIESEFAYAKYLKGIAKVENKIVLIQDLEMFLSLNEEQLIDNAVADLR
jgi:purine-binding chemotaxis protein CheW